MKIKALLYFGLFFTFWDLALARVRIRARENFEAIQIRLNDDRSWDYWSPSHTFNIWYEKPFDLALGLATGPFVMSYPESSSPSGDRPSQLGKSIRLIHHHLEFKKWFFKGIFLRAGYGISQFNSNAEDGKDFGRGYLIGGGYEFDLGGIGLAFEVDNRQLKLDKKQWEISSQMFAIGVHFYDFL